MRRIYWLALSTPQQVHEAISNGAWVEYSCDSSDKLDAPAHDQPGSGGWIRCWDQRHGEQAAQLILRGGRYRARVVDDITPEPRV